MKQLKNALAAVALLAGVATTAQAYTVDGVTWDPNAGTDFTSQSVNIRQFIDSTTGVVSGFGVITAMNGNANFCNNCQLTFQFGGLTPSVAGALPGGAGTSIIYSGGWVNFYAGAVRIANPFDYSQLTAANTMTNTLWLGTTMANDFVGSVDASGQVLSGLGFLNVTGGNAASYLNTNTQANGTDLRFTSSFTFPWGPSLNDMSGTGNLFGKSVKIPEPASLALVGLALVGLGLSRRKAAK